MVFWLGFGAGVLAVLLAETALLVWLISTAPVEPALDHDELDHEPGP